MNHTTTTTSRKTSTPILPFILITSLFFMWGVANNMTDTLLSVFKRVQSMTDLQTSFIQVAFYGAYFCLALPAAIFIKRYSYKSGVLLGLGLFIVGGLLFYPSSKTMIYGHFLASLYILASGLSILETACNPYILSMGPPETATQRLNLAQSFNPIGSISGVLLSKFFILSQLNSASAEERASMGEEQLKQIQSSELAAVMGPYVGVALFLIILWLTIAIVRMPKASDAGSPVDLLPTLKRLFKKKHYVWGVLAQFFYIGVQIGVWSFTIRYVMQELNCNEEEASAYYLYALVVFTVARFVNTALMKFVKPRQLLTYAAMVGLMLILIVIVGSGIWAVYALIGISACLSLMFPTIYGLALHGLGKDTKIASSGLIMAILGGALITPFQAFVSDASGSIHTSYWVPFVCMSFIVIYGLTQKDNP